MQQVNKRAKQMSQVVQSNFARNSSTVREQLVIQDNLRDSTVWGDFAHRQTDLVITSCYRSGTTLTQQIVNLLIHGHDDFEKAYQLEEIHQLSPWVEFTWYPTKEEKIKLIEKLPNPRFFKTHLPFDAVPYYSEWKYICLFRDLRDVAMSLFNQANAYTPQAYELFASKLNAAANFAEFWDKWLENGEPYWEPWNYINSWWKERHNPNILFVHYADLINHKPKEIEKIADFLDIKLDPSMKETILERSSLKYMQENSDKFEPKAFQRNRFIYLGVNDRWKSLLNKEQLKKYQEITAQKLEPECINWLENAGDLPD